jgi:alkylresorcinol/alkylpyrone synthase
VVTGASHPRARGPRIVATRSAFYRNTEDVMGWAVGDRGFKIVLSAAVPEMVRVHLEEDVTMFLRDQGLTVSDIGCWIAHPGGPKVLEAMEDVFSLPRTALEKTWSSLRTVGNLSSASVLLVLEDTLADPPPPGTWGLLLAMGPGFCSEVVLLRWDP